MHVQPVTRVDSDSSSCDMIERLEKEKMHTTHD